MKKIIKDWYNSFFSNREGLSARKLTAFTVVVMIVMMHYNYVTPDNVVDVLFYDQLFVLLLLGIVTAGQLLEARGCKQ